MSQFNEPADSQSSPSALGQGLLPPGPATQALQKAMLLRFKKEIPQAIEVSEKAYRLFQQNKNYLGLAYSTIELAWLYGATMERARSDKLFRDAEEMIEAHSAMPGMHEVRARYFHYKGLILYQNGDYGPAVKFFKYAMTFCAPNGLEAAKIYDSLGVHYERTGDFHRAVRYLKSSLAIKTQLKEPIQEEAITCQILGRLHLLYEDYELAYQHLQRSLQISGTLKDEKRKASLKNELIRLFLRCGKEPEAVTLIHEARQDSQNRHLKIQYSMTCFYEAYLYFRHQEHDKAKKLLDKEVTPIFQKFRYQKGLAMAKRLEAWVTFALDPHNTIKPIELVGEAIELFRWEHMIDEVAKSHFELGKLYHEVGNHKLALASFMDALKIAEENGLFYLTPYIEDEIFRTHEPQWEEIVSKRTRHERVFEKRHSLVDALSDLMVSFETVSEHLDGEYKAQTDARANNIPFLMSLLKVGQAMAAERDLDKLLQILKLETQAALKATSCDVFLYDSETNELWSRLPVPGSDTLEEIRFPAHQGLSGYVVKTGEMVNIEDAYQDPRFNKDVDRLSGTKTNTMLCLPMRNRKGDIIGVFQLLNKHQGVFSRTDEELLMAIAASASVAVENAQLYRELKSTFDSFIQTLSTTIDARDPITAGHSERVMEYSVLIGERMNLAPDEMEVLRYSALLHDIGKIGVKEEILIKEGRLTEKEYRHIQEHVFFTHEILKNIRFEKHLASVPDVAAAHHEKMDGSGYFRGLKGDQIILGGRILAVADVFDAITSRRQYRNRMPFERVMNVLRAECGSHFDGDIIDIFMEISLADLGRVLCMDRRLPVPQEEIDRVMRNLPQHVSIGEYLEMMRKDRPSREESQIIQHFTQLYHFSEISDLD